MRRRAEVGGGKQPQKTSKASEGSQRGHSRRSAGEPRPWRRATAYGQPSSNPAECSGGECRPMSAARERGSKSNRRRPYAVKAARTVTTGGMERRVEGYRALSLPTMQAAKRPGLAEEAYGE